MTEGLRPQTRPVAGGIETIPPAPGDATKLFVGPVNGGVWKTDNATNASPTWMPLLDVGPDFSISRLEFDPTISGNATLIGAVGHTSNFLSSGSALNGLVRTTDGGAAWTHLGTTSLSGVDITRGVERGNRIQVPAKAPTSGGGYRSTAYRSTFTRLS